MGRDTGKLGKTVFTMWRAVGKMGTGLGKLGNMTHALGTTLRQWGKSPETRWPRRKQPGLGQKSREAAFLHPDQIHFEHKRRVPAPFLCRARINRWQMRARFVS